MSIGPIDYRPLFILLAVALGTACDTPNASDSPDTSAEDTADALGDTPADTAHATGGPDTRDASTDTRSDVVGDANTDDANGADAHSTLADLPGCEAPIAELFTDEAIEPPGRGSNGYRPPSQASRRAVRASIAALAAGEAGRVQRNAKLGGYRVCRRETAAGPVVVWRPDTPTDTPTKGRARWAVRPDRPAADLVVQAPHIQYDLDTLEESRQIFETAGARALLAAGTHRCANVAASSCSGKTGACSEDRKAYRTSDMAHNTDTMFQAAHRALAAAYPDAVTASIHGFSLEGISLSDGTQDPTSKDAPSARLGRALSTRLPQVRVTHCNRFPGADHRERFCGTTNVQGRHLNGVDAACTTFADTASGRFIHVEQTRSVRKNHRAAVAEAFADAFPTSTP